jgi:hypothetical protein
MALSPTISPCDHSSSRSPRFVPQSSKQHRKSRALVLVSAINSQFTANSSTRDRTILIPSPLRATGSNPSGKAGPSLETDSA